MIGDARETYSDSTLKSFKKSALIEVIRCLERNLKSANETIDIQTAQCEKLIDSTKKAYYEQGRADGFHKGVLAQTKEQLSIIAQTEKDIRTDERAKVIEEYRKEMQEMIEGDEEFTEWQKKEILELNEIVAEEFKEQKND